MRKLLTTHGVRLLLAFLCIVAGFSQMKAATWTVAGSPTSVFNGKSWDPSATANDMTLSSGTTYTWTSPNFTFSANIEFKVCKDHGWGEAYPSNNYVIDNPDGKTYKLTITFNSSSHNITVNLAEQTAPTFDATKRKFAVTGAAFGGWNMPPSNAQTFTNNGDGTYTLEFNGATTGEFKLSGISDDSSFGSTWDVFNSGAMGKSGLVQGDNNLNTSFGTGNMAFPVSGDVVLTISNVTATSCKLNISGQVQPVEPAYYLIGEFNSWDEGTKEAFNNNNGTFTLTKTFSGEFSIINENGTYLSCAGGKTLTRTDNTVTLAQGGYAENLNLTASSNYTLTIANGVLTVTGFPELVYSVAGEPTSVFGGENAWDLNVPENVMTLNNGTYTWTKNNFVYGANPEFKIIQDHSIWLAPEGNNNNYVITDGLKNNTYNLTITFNPSTKEIGHQLTLVSQAAEAWHLYSASNNWASPLASFTQDGTSWKLENQSISGEFKVVNQNEVWYGGSDGTEFTFRKQTHTLSTDGSNMTINPNGTYTLTIENGVLTVSGFTYPDLYFRHWTSNEINDSEGVKMTNNGDGTYTLTGVSLENAENMIITTGQTGNWTGSGTRYAPNGDADQTVTSGTEYTVAEDGGKAFKTNATTGEGTWTITFNIIDLKFKATQTAAFEKETGEMYIIGRANGGVFQADLGTPMENKGNGVYQADNVQLMSGADFSFTAKLGNDAEDWATANKYRYFNTAGYCIEVQDNQVGSVADNTTGTEFGLQDTGDGATGNSNFKLKTSGAYRITVNTNTMKVHFEKMYASLYMFGKGFSWGSTTPNAWDPTSAIPMTTTDGKIYHLDAVKFENVEAAGFIFSTVVANNNDDGGKQWVAKNGFFPSNEYDYVIHKNDQQNDINKALTMVEGSTDDAAALTNFNSHRWTIWGTEVAADNAKYNVVVDIEKKTVTLKENVPIKNELTIRLEQTDNLKGKYPAVQVWITDNNQMLTKYQGAWIDGDEGNTMNNQPGYGSGSHGHTHDDVTLDGNMWYKCREYTSYDNRKWWEWEIGGTEFRIASIHFYRNDDYNDTPSDPNGDLSRRSGVLYYTWVDREIEDHTADYYVDHVKEAPDCATMLDDHLYVYFVNTPGWSTVYCHAWDENGNSLLPHKDSSSEPADNAGWPGDICIVVGYNEDGFAVYRYDFGLKSLWEGKTIAGVIFNSGPGEGGSVAEQTGDFTPFKNGASYDYVGRVSLGRSLGNIIAKGVVKGPKYDVEDDLVVVYYNPGESGTIQVPYIDEEGNQQIAITNYTGAYYAKDINNANEKSFNYDGKLDYVFDVTQFNAPKPYINEGGQTVAAGEKVELLMQGRTRYDQSNWVRLVKANDYSGTSAWTGGGLVNKKIKGDMLSGQLVDNLNPTMIVEELPADAISATTYVLNDYIAPHFNDNYSVNDNGDLFFVRPKANEVAHITWAVYKGNNEFYTPDSWAGLNNANTADGSTTGDMFNHGNAYNLKGGFKVVSWAFAGYDAAPETLTPNQAYQFDAIIRYKDNTSNGAPIITPQGGSRLKEGARVDYDDSFDVNNSQFEVYPVNVNPSTWIVTGIDEIETDAIAKEVVAVKYYNIMGVEQRELQPGVNIVVTIYNDGSRSSAKILK